MSDDTMTCPISGKTIGPGEGEAVLSMKGNLWIVHPSVPLHLRFTDAVSGPQRINGVKPVHGPDAWTPITGYDPADPNRNEPF